MSFVHPLFLWALTALSIPIIIHLFNFRRIRKVYFSNTRILQAVREASSKKRKLRHLLVLCSRLLFILFLVLAFAQPFLPAKEDLGSGKDVMIFLDTSPSMSVPMPDKSRVLDHAITYTRAILSLFPHDTRFLLLTNDFIGSNSFKSRQEILEQISSIRLSPHSRTFKEVMRRFDKSPESEVFFISDFQKSGVQDLNITDSTRKVAFVPVYPDKPRNIYVDSVAFEKPYLINGEKTRLTIWLRNDSRERIDQVTVKLSQSSTLASLLNLTMEPLATIPVYLDVLIRDTSSPLQITLQDFPVIYDNDFYLSALPSPKLMISHLYDGKLRPYIPSVYGNNALFTVRSQSFASIDYDILEKSDLIVIEGINKSNPGLNRYLIDHPDQQIFFIPAEDPDPEFISKLTGVTVSRSKSQTKIPLAIPTFRDPFFENVFEERSDDLKMPEAIPLLILPPDRSAILQFRDGSPMLSRKGRFFITASTLNPTISDLASHAIFVPIMYRIAAGSDPRPSKPYYYLNEGLFEIKTDSMLSDEPVRLTGPMEWIPEQRFISGNIILQIPSEGVNPGNYQVMRGRDTLSLVAFNYSRSESKMDYMTPEEILKSSSSVKNVTVFESGSVQAFSKEIKERYLGIPLWKYCLVLSLVFLIAEVLLLRFFRVQSNVNPKISVQSDTI